MRLTPGFGKVPVDVLARDCWPLYQEVASVTVIHYSRSIMGQNVLQNGSRNGATQVPWLLCVIITSFYRPISYQGEYLVSHPCQCTLSGIPKLIEITDRLSWSLPSPPAILVISDILTQTVQSSWWHPQQVYLKRNNQMKRKLVSKTIIINVHSMAEVRSFSQIILFFLNPRSVLQIFSHLILEETKVHSGQETCLGPQDYLLAESQQNTNF